MNTLSAKHKKTLQAVFSTPTPVTLEWRKIEALFIALGAIATEGNGSRVRFEINQVVAVDLHFIVHTRKKKRKPIRFAMPEHSLKL